jgi:hypothetical protein
MSPQAHCLVVYASLNQVHRVKRRLYQGGVFVDMVRAPKCLGVSGCSFALRCEPELLSAVRRASIETAIEIRGVFSESLAGYCPLP